MRIQDIVKIERAIIPKQTHNFIICSSVISKEQSVKRYVRRGKIGTKSTFDKGVIPVVLPICVPVCFALYFCYGEKNKIDSNP